MVTIHTAVQMFIHDRVLRGMADATIEGYDSLLNRMVDSIGKGVYLEDAPILEYCYDLAKRGNAKSTLWNYLKQIRAWHSWCVESELCKPINIPKMKQPIRS